MSTVSQTVADFAGHHTQDDSLLVGVSVPATSANLGPGYDALGVALDVPLVAVAGNRVEERVISTGFGGGELPTDDGNLVWRAVLAWCEHAGEPAPDVSITVRSAIPLERGMGSSSAAAVAGLALGRALVGGGGGSRAMLALATELEGHPDNAAAAIMGGLTLCTPDGEVHRVTPDPKLQPILLIPSQRQSTEAARSILPDSLPIHEAAGNAARGMATFAGLAGLVPLTVQSMTDSLHEPSRLEMMADTGAVVRALRDSGVATVLSGAGPAALALVPSADPEVVQLVKDLTAQATSGRQDFEVLPVAWDLSGVVTCPPGHPS